MKQSTKLKIQHALTDNIGLKIMALFFALALWLIVVNVDDPTQTRTFSAPVAVINENVLTEAGRYYTIPDGNNTVQFRVTARRSVIERLSNRDFTAVADMNYLEDDCRIPVTITANNANANVTISSKKLYLRVVVGNDVAVNKEIVVEATGELADNCVISATEVNPKSVKVTGPDEILSQIAKVVAYVDVTGASSDVSAENTMLHFLDENGMDVDRSRITVERENADVTVYVLREKNVDITVKTSGELAEGLYLDEITVEPTSVNIIGPSEQLNDITVITIPESVINLSEIQETTTTTVDLNSYLPENVRVASSESTEAKITVKISGDSVEAFEIPMENIAVRNLADGLQATFAEENIKVKITAGKEDLAKLKKTDITGYVDASGLSAGEYNLQLNLELDEAYKTEQTTVKITIE